MKRTGQDNWKILGQETVYDGRMHILKYDVVLPGGQKTTYEVDHNDSGAVAVLIKYDEDNIVVSYQYRFPLNKWIYDLPGGRMNKGEGKKEAAIRECQEEVGIIPNKLIELNEFFPNPGRSDWSSTIFYCEDYSSSKIETNDPSEQVETVIMKIGQMKKLIDDRKIVDPILLIAWYTAIAKGYIKVKS